LSLVPNDAEESVRVECAAIVAALAVTAHRLLVAQQLAGQRAASGDAATPAVRSAGSFRSSVPAPVAPSCGTDAAGVFCFQLHLDNEASTSMQMRWWLLSKA